MSQIIWEVTPLAAPAVIRACPKCGAKKPFVHSGKFRVNAQQRNLDVWLIYRCTDCGTTWNMEIHSRVSPRELSPNAYRAYLENDAAMAERCAFDRQLHRKNRADADYSGVALEISGPSISPETLSEPVLVTLRCRYPLPLRAEAAIRQKLGLSRSALERMRKDGYLQCGADLRRARLDAELTFTLLPAPPANPAP